MSPLVLYDIEDLLAGKLTMLLNDANHPLQDALANQLTPRSGRMRVPYAATNRYPSSFISVIVYSPRIVFNIFNVSTFLLYACI